MLIDCPGHLRLVHLFQESLKTHHSPRGVILLLDSATLTKNVSAVANYVYSTLTTLPRPVHVLMVANKSDLFTALPVAKIRELIETEINNIKKSTDNSTIDDDEERIDLGGSDFRFGNLDDDGIMVDWQRTSIETKEDLDSINRWISEQMS
jgi:signal recognition particle receptor subunit beta